MAAPTLETNAAADTLRIMGGNSGNPVTWNDVWDWDDGGGSSGGAGDVPKDGGGTAKVNTFMTETVADAVYLVLKNIDFGDGVAPTYFRSANGELVYFFDGCQISIKNNATLSNGFKSGDWGLRGAAWNVQGLGSPVIANTGTGVHNIYASLIHARGTVQNKWDGGTLEILNSIFSQRHDLGYSNHRRCLSVGYWGATTLDATLKDVFINGGSKNLLIQLTNSLTMEDIRSHAGLQNIVCEASGVIGDNIYSTSAIDWDWNVPSANNDITAKDPKNSVIPRLGNDTNCWIAEVYTCNIHIADKDGVDLGTANIKCEDKDDNEIFSVNTNAGGDIADQIITYKKWEGTSETLTTYSPHKFTISKAGYETMVLDAVTVDEKINWHLELLDELAEGDVRDGVAYGEDSEGNLELPAAGDVEDGVGFGSNGVEFTGDFGVPPEADVRDGEGYGAGGAEFEGDLDLPAIGDVEKGVQFDSLTKTGTFKKPGESDVRDGSQYGKDDTEFTGTLDLPAEADVEDGVIFDGATKEGNFEAPAEADVEKDVGYGSNGAEFTGTFEAPAEEDVEVGVGYGAGGTEFEGEYLGLTGTNLTAVLENETNLTATLEEETNMTGYLEKVC